MAHLMPGDTDWPSAEKIVEYVIHDHERACRNFPHLRNDLAPRLPGRIVEALEGAGYAPRAFVMPKQPA